MILGPTTPTSLGGLARRGNERANGCSRAGGQVKRATSGGWRRDGGGRRWWPSHESDPSAGVTGGPWRRRRRRRGARDEEIARVRLLAPVRRSMVAFHRASQVIDFAGDFCWLMGIWAQKSRRGAARHGVAHAQHTRISLRPVAIGGRRRACGATATMLGAGRPVAGQ